jgi:prolyl-tRNA editing enzyme YbaK/EbsC (Cys-tRNA(Pro) deacylase)
MNKYSFENLRLLLINNKIYFKVITHKPVFTMEDVTKELNIHQEAMAKALIIDADDRGLLRIIIPGTDRLDIKKLALIINVSEESIHLADRKSIEQLGLTIGAIPPFGGDLPTYIDSSFLNQNLLYCGAGDNDKTFSIKPCDVIHLTSAVIIHIPL